MGEFGLRDHPRGRLDDAPPARSSRRDETTGDAVAPVVPTARPPPARRQHQPSRRRCGRDDPDGQRAALSWHPATRLASSRAGRVARTGAGRLRSRRRVTPVRPHTRSTPTTSTHYEISEVYCRSCWRGRASSTPT
ncbi:hypothetical protein HBB16_01780 [Pseudonocardia sp. MCCB 268]|nr:hypothetical protein [Pseudonocardia cytotoxica]